jgi:2-keto-4-pentenoate hydratase/2-oxohepta-3-ene-1,7-dioic acid hydratase in catechol pathway
MRIIRFQRGQEPPRYGWILEGMVGEIEGSIYSEYRRQELEYSLDSVRLLAPVEPGKIICIGRNYADHAKEVGSAVPEIPILFMKPSTSVIGPNQPILIPPQSQQVEHEGEVAVVIGRKGRWVLPENAADHILGYTIANDVTARDLQRRDGQWTRGKGFDTFCPLGPWVETEFDPSDALLTCHVNQELRQMSSTRDMVFNIRQLVAFISSVMTLLPGDLILTGTPAGIGPLGEGDVVRVTVEGIGELRNPVGREPHRA